MDQNNDDKITVDDIKNFASKNNFQFNENIYYDMFDDAAKSRKINFKKQLLEPLNLNEIWMAVQLHYKLNKDHQWIENPKPFRKYWITLLQKAGENLPKKHDLEKIKFQPIYDLYQKQKLIQTFHPQISIQNQSVNKILIIKYIILFQFLVNESFKKSYISKPKPEAGLEIKDTNNISQINFSQTADFTIQKKPVEDFEKIVNLKFKQQENNQFSQTVDFDTKNYYQEALRLSLNPILYKKSSKNPILLYVPENFNFQSIQNKEEEYNHRTSEIFKKSNFQYNNKSIQKDRKTMCLNQFDKLKTMKNNPYPFNVFDKDFYSRKYQINKIGNKEEKILESNHFITTFKLENCTSLKSKLAQSSNLQSNPYKPISNNIIREEINDDKSKPNFKIQFKCDPLPNKYGMSEHDSRPKLAIEKEQKIQKQKMEEEQKNINDYYGKKQNNEWIKYFKLCDKQHNIGDGKQTEFINKGGIYYEPLQIQQSLLRQEDDFKIPFRLAHRTLRAKDKNMFLGQIQDSKF
ncbi:hypothetical protein IMG5_152540 [Ichthyophthirius multifiliis]|uniref:EF-hand domain-containing protein n=1 Tax=Ichthyophthirius multifiliis TaxID=5932 RepID=G0QYV9_ICHMU|nr:hypothetical protein IMG5_152540 [Ichthyophthirius multifiliis]EGR29604.1 hypothetical protein IMG5_152540 [Ichthyophthirius multifiliis]|eukprot:XP_004030840.1 hypothetical protein IMG5_152540 [Ichthyophthirius multifiliis]